MASSVTQWAPPSGYSQELAVEILRRVSQGQSLWTIYRSDPGRFPHPSTWIDWHNADSALALAHAQAKELGADWYAQDAMDILDAEPGRVQRYNEKGEIEDGRIDPSAVVLAKARAELRMKRAAQINPRAYGDKTLLAGHDGGAIKSETAISLPDMIERLRQAKRTTPAPAVIEQGGDGIEFV